MYVLRLNCIDKPGIVAAVASALSNNQCNIEESAQFNDVLSGHFFMRVVFNPLQDKSLDQFKSSFDIIAHDFDMRYHICDLNEPIKTILMVSQYDHCLNDLLYRTQKNNLALDIKAIVSNHETAQNIASAHDLPFHHLPISKDNKLEQEGALQSIMDEHEVELVVLARYMQILSDNFCKQNSAKVINIHHSFLPGFKGAKPYHQAYARGVKMIGATAHFATADLDEGPIITQEIMPVDHSATPSIMQELGQDTECRALAAAVKLFAQRRIFLHEGRTIIL